MRYLLYKSSEWIESHNVPFIYSHALNRPLSRISHCHDFYEIIYLFTGTARHCINGHFFDMTAGDVAILRPYEQHCFFEQSEHLELFSISVTVAEFEPLLHSYHIFQPLSSNKESIQFSLDGNSRHLLCSRFNQLEMLTNDHREWNLRIILGETIHEYLKYLADGSFDWFDNLMIQMKKQQNLQEGVSAFLKISNLSHAQLCRVIKKRTGKTPQQFIKELRMTHAYDLIISTNLSFDEISLLIGYSSLSHFITSFKQKYGITPSALRKNHHIL